MNSINVTNERKSKISSILLFTLNIDKKNTNNIAGADFTKNSYKNFF